MKNLIYILLVTALLFSSCDDFLDTDSPSKQTNNDVYSKLSFTDAALMGIYGTLTEATIYGQKISTNWPTNSDIEIAGLSTDNYMSSTRDAGASNYYASAENANLRWDVTYKMVELAASAVDGIRSSPLMKTSDSTKMKSYLGEALALKALGYFELVKHFGDIPFKREASKSDLSNVFIGKTDRDTVYKYIIKDLLEAEKYVGWKANSFERINKGFIKGLTARAALFAGGWSIRDRNQFPNIDVESHPKIAEMNGYLTGRTKDWKHYYEIAAQQCAEIIGSAENPHGLDNFENLWKTVNQLQSNQANENLFEIAFGLGNSSDIGNLIGMRLEGSTKYGTIALGGGNVVTTAYYFYSFDKEDARRDVTVTNISYSPDNKEKFNNNPVDWKFSKWRIYWMTDAYKALHKQAESGRVSTGINWIVMRYSDILLMYAEAQNELYGSSSVNHAAGITPKQALELVRKRAFGSASSKITNYDSNFFDAIVNERAWEFGGEALRKYDLIRWGLLGEKIEAQKVALCKILDGKGEVHIFDKVYQAEDLPTTVYYLFDTPDTDKQEYIVRSSINYYDNLGTAPSANHQKVTWLSEYSRKDIKTVVTRILIASTGLNASYNYSSLVSQMDSAVTIQTMLNQYNMGNKICNYRHPFSIYSKNITDSRNLLKNSYGY